VLDSIYLTVNQWMTGNIALAALGCFVWGMISALFSPCLPIAVAGSFAANEEY
jgi:cytochrome c-type biogenesis protein